MTKIFLLKRGENLPEVDGFAWLPKRGVIMLFNSRIGHYVVPDKDSNGGVGRMWHLTQMKNLVAEHKFYEIEVL